MVTVFLFLIPRLYLGQSFEKWTRVSKNGEPEWNLFQYFFDVIPVLHTKLSWLWFLVGLYLANVTNYPLMCWCQRRQSGIKVDLKQDGLLIILQCVLIMMFALMVLAYNKFIHELLFALLTYSVTMAIFFSIQSFLCSYPDIADDYALYMKLVGPLACIVINQFKYQTRHEGFYQVLMMIVYFLLFYSQGVIDNTWSRQMENKRNQLAETLVAPLGFFLIVVLFGITTPHDTTG